MKRRQDRGGSIEYVDMASDDSDRDVLLTRAEWSRLYRLRNARALAILASVGLLVLSVVLIGSWALGPDYRWLVGLLALPATIAAVAAASWRINRWALRCPHCSSDISTLAPRVLAVGTCPICGAEVVADGGTVSLTRWRRFNRVEQRRKTVPSLWIWTAFAVFILYLGDQPGRQIFALAMLLVPLYGAFRLRRGRHRFQARWLAIGCLAILVWIAASSLLP